jgi:hypothetical protein
MPKAKIYRSLRFLGGAMVLLVLSAVFSWSYLSVRRSWEEKVLRLELQVSQITKDGSQREETLGRENLQKERLIQDRKAENQSLAALADKTLEQLKASLDDLRRLREEKVKLETDYRASLEGVSQVTRFFSAWLPAWLGKGEVKREETPANPSSK